MNELLNRLASPVRPSRGLLLAILAFVMTTSPIVATLWLQSTSSLQGDYETSGLVLAITWGLAYLGVVPLLFATVSLFARPVRPAWLMPVAVAVALVQPVVHVLSVAQVVRMDIATALLTAVVTGSSAGVLAVGLRRLESPAQLINALLTAVGVSIMATAALMVLTAALVSLTIAILLIVQIMRDRQNERRQEVPATESVA
jgi:hypothetical protein